MSMPPLALGKGLQPVPSGRRLLIRIGGALVCVAIASVLTALIRPVLSQFAFGFYYAAVIVASYYFGLTGGIIATLFSALVTDYFFVAPAGRVLSTVDEVVALAVFVAVASLIAILIYLRRSSESKVQERERFVDYLTRNSPAPLYLYDVINQRPLYTSLDGVEASPGTAGDIVPAAALPYRTTDPAQKARFEQHLEALARAADGVVMEFEYSMGLADGDVAWFATQDRVIERTAGGAASKVLGVVQNVTARKMAQQQVYFQARLLDSVEEAVIAVDNAGRIVFCNKFAETLYGWHAAEVLGHNILDVVPAQESLAESAAIMEQLITGQRWSGEQLVRRSDGTVFLAGITDAPIFDAAGQLTGVVGVSVDISQRKKSEDHLRFLADASMELSTSLDYKSTLQRVCDLVVPKLSSWCAVDFVRPGGEIELVAVSHVDPAKVAWARELRRRYPPTLADEGGVAQVIRTGKPEYYPTISTEMIEQSTTDEDLLEIMREIGFRSLIIVPMRARGRILGALTMVWSESGRQYSQSDLIFAEELAARAAIAVDNAILYAEVSLAERQQAELLAQMEALVANAPAGIAFFDRDLHYLRVNGAMAELNGLPIEAHLEHSMHEILPELADVAEPYINQVFETGRGIYNVELSGANPTAPDVVRYCIASWYPVMLDHGRPMYVGAMVVEITERIRVEAALRESEDRFRAAFEQAAVGMAHISLGGVWVRVNERLCEILGYTGDELMRMHALDVAHPDDREIDRVMLDRLLAGDLDGYHVEKRCIQKDGRLVWVGLTLSLVRDLDTQLARYFVAVVEDIGERKAAETQLRLLAESSNVLSNTLYEERTLQGVADLITPLFADWCAINLVDADQQITQIASAHADPEKAQLLREIAVAFPLDVDAPTGTPAVIRSGKSHFAPIVHHAMATSDPRLALVWPLGVRSLMIVPLQARQQIFGAMTLARTSALAPFTAEDLQFVEELAQRIALTLDNASLYRDARASQMMLRHLNETLETRVKERTAELERSNRELDRFAYVASHDLKAPLRAIDNLATWLYEDALGYLPAPSQEHLVKLRGRVQRMERLLDDLLAYSRAGRVQHAPERVDTALLIQNVFDLLAPPPKFSLQIGGALPVMMTQRVPLETVLRNLIGNAIKHHHRADGWVRVTTTEQGAWLEFAISDDGPGMAPQYHERIFEMFQTLQPRDQVEGSGMGLAIVKKTVESMGGMVTVDSVEGEGTCFRFTWPKAVVHVETNGEGVLRKADV